MVLAFAERLGLETDWNCCILLSDDNENTGTGYVEMHDIKAKLPRGIAEIKRHLEQVDDIPLHVSLFADCSPKSTREMVEVFQSYNETVCCLGSTLDLHNCQIFSKVSTFILIARLILVLGWSLLGPRFSASIWFTREV